MDENLVKEGSEEKIENPQNVVKKNNVNPKKKNFWPTFIIIAIIIFSFIIRIGYFIDTKDQVVWWDEAEYLVKAKHIAFGTSDEGWNPLREPLMSIFWALLYKIGATELIIRITSFLFAILSIYLTYLVGKELFNEGIGVISSFLMSIYHQHIFFTYRMLIDIPATVFWLLSIYFFWRGFVKQEGKKYIYLTALFLGLGFLAHYSLLFLGIILFIFLLITSRFTIFKNKDLWIGLLIIILIISPYIIWSLINYNTPLPRYATAYQSTQTATVTFSAWNHYLKYIGIHLQPLLLFLFIFGSILFVTNIIISLDLIIKKKEKSTISQLLILLWILIPLIIYTYVSIYGSGISEPRYILLILPPISIVIATLLLKSYNLLMKRSKLISIAFIILVIVLSSIWQIKAADTIINSKKDGLTPAIKQAGLYLKSKTVPSDTVSINSMQMELQYYSERRVIGFSSNASELQDKISSENIKYLVINGLYKAEDWTYAFPEQHKDLVEEDQGIYADPEGKQFVLYIYKIK